MIRASVCLVGYITLLERAVATNLIEEGLFWPFTLLEGPRHSKWSNQ